MHTFLLKFSHFQLNFQIFLEESLVTELIGSGDIPDHPGP